MKTLRLLLLVGCVLFIGGWYGCNDYGTPTGPNLIEVDDPEPDDPPETDARINLRINFIPPGACNIEFHNTGDKTAYSVSYEWWVTCAGSLKMLLTDYYIGTIGGHNSWTACPVINLSPAYVEGEWVWDNVYTIHFIWGWAGGVGGEKTITLDRMDGWKGGVHENFNQYKRDD